MSNKAIFFDRDGVINLRYIDNYVKSTDDFVFHKDIFQILPKVKTLNYKAIVITNQRCISRGIISESKLSEIHNFMQDELMNNCGFNFNAIYYCPHEKEFGCDCRKPKPGMILKASLDIDIDLSNSWMIGDSISDIEAGENAGCKTAYLNKNSYKSKANITGETLTEIWDKIIQY
ncbi:MAG: HAD family hydrolase [Chlorobiota bacterium]|nr:MAG: HAD family hydrolase [Chlorobiota bacterium]